METIIKKTRRSNLFTRSSDLHGLTAAVDCTNTSILILHLALNCLEANLISFASVEKVSIQAKQRQVNPIPFSTVGNINLRSQRVTGFLLFSYWDNSPDFFNTGGVVIFLCDKYGLLIFKPKFKLFSEFVTTQSIPNAPGGEQ